MLDLQALTKAVGDLDEPKVLDMLKEFVATNPSSEETEAVVSACQKGMGIVGDLFDAKEYFVGDLIFAGELLNSALDILKPVMSVESNVKSGKIVLATVEGDLHDIGKNIFKSMSEAAGFEVHDLGIDVPASTFVEKVKEIKPEILGMSGVLTLALDSMKKTVDALKEAGLRDEVKVIIGGNPVTEEACRMIGADAFTTNAAEGVKMCQQWVS
ncbi:cobalamin B12-binding domain-containing protein [Desulfallas thermosapovorans]|uniref:Methanogenic corrinoid protein MtbC1 n=1 Tax=Desulfallas thermosapovorans DSM 6562 TaxID=1121431 RepID=A0A5S4ZPB6_9FIRM|nr:cobalamin-dependent protein [Desulfallas thermosapovorans]TYO93914.1 methanogenic corrinoid protein MtbC1 [Desulfallas thermosapovorans DSM 6562]